MSARHKERMIRFLTPAVLLLVLPLILVSCSTTTEKGVVGVQRPQTLWMPASEVMKMSLASYDQVKGDAQKKGELDQKPEMLARVSAIAKRLIPETANFRKDAPSWPWEVHVITSPDINAYCMPGGKIIVYSGLIEKLQSTDGELAAVMGHEISHALREHGRERMTHSALEQVGFAAAAASGVLDSQSKAQLATLGATFLLTLPNGRTQETEADEIGLELMARAGYNPQEAASLWKKMSASGGSKPPEWMSTHPADSTRLSRIESLMPRVTPLYQASKH